MKAKLILFAAGVGVCVQAIGAPARFSGSCDHELSAVEGARVFADVLADGSHSCSTVYVGPQAAEAQVKRIHYGPATARTCRAVDALVRKINAASAQVARLIEQVAAADPATEAGRAEMLAALARADVAQRQHHEALGSYRKTIVQEGVRVTYTYDLKWRETIARLAARNPGLGVKALDLKDVRLLTDTLSRESDPGRYLDSAPGFLGAQIGRRTFYAWDGVRELRAPDFVLSPQNDQVTVTEIYSAAQACPMLGGDEPLASVLAVQGSYAADGEGPEADYAVGLGPLGL